MNIRMTEISKYIKQNGSVRLSDLETLFPDISAMTLRRDLIKLENMGEIIRTHGGARSVEDISRIKEDLYTKRATENIIEKNIIAQKALSVPRNGHTVFLDSGTTITILAQTFVDEKLFVITAAPNIALECAKKLNITVFLTGGLLNKDNLSLVGGYASTFLADINIDMAYMAASAFTPHNAFTCGNYEESVLKKEIITKASKVVMLMDRTKFGKNMPFTFARLSEIDVFITDNNMPDEFSSEFKKYEVEVL